MESLNVRKILTVDRSFPHDPVSASLALGAGGLFMQSQANNDAKKAASKATGNQKELIKRQTELFDKLAGIVSGHDAAGGFDPQKQLDQLGKDTEYYSQRDMGNTAGTARSLGYRPGDTGPLKQIRSIDSAYKLKYGQEANRIRTSAFTDKLSAYRAIDPSALNPGIQSYANMANQANSQQGGFGQLAGTIQPFLQTQKPQVNTGKTNWDFLKNWH
jgi:hypothetical protein